MSSERKQLNPTALEFRPFSQNNSSIFPTPPLDAATFHHLSAVAPPPPPPPPPQPYAYYPSPMTVYYHHHHHHHLFLSSVKRSPPYYFPKSDVILPLADEGLGLVTSPTSVLSPPEPVHRSPITSPLSEPSHDARILRRTARKKYGPSNPGRISRNLMWVKKKKSESADTTADEITDATPALPIASYPFGDSTSLMIRNIPVRLSRGELMGMLDDHCRSQNERLSFSAETHNTSEPASQFDFLYLPIDFRRKGNLGYAFVNFTSWEGASRLYNSWKGSKWENCSYNTKKICQIFPAKFQGKELKRHFKESVFQCETDEYLPVEITPPRDGSNVEDTKLLTIGRRVYGYQLT